MGRRDTTIDALDGKVAEFALELRDVRAAGGNPTYAKMARMTGFTAPALSGAARGVKPPTWSVTEAYLTACGVTGEATMRMWRQRLAEVRNWYADQQIHRARFVQTSRRTIPQHRAAVSAYTALPGEHAQLPLTGDARQMLNQLKDQTRMSYRTIAARSAANDEDPMVLTSSTTQEMLTGKRALTTMFVQSYLEAVGADVVQAGQVLRQLQMEQAFHDASARMKQGITAALVTIAAEDHIGDLRELLVTNHGDKPVMDFEVDLVEESEGRPVVNVLAAGSARHGRQPKSKVAMRLRKPTSGKHRATPSSGRWGALLQAARAGLGLVFGDLTTSASGRV